MFLNITMNRENKTCQNCKNNFVIEQEDFNFYEKIKVPPPTFCPECRLVRRLCWRNERSLYKRECDLCHKNIISMYDKEVIFPVYCPECWRSDIWDSQKYTREYDFSKTFFEQFKELFSIVPRISVWSLGNNLNVEYANFVYNSKKIYLSYSIIDDSEDIFFSSNIDSSKSMIDVYNASKSEFIYESIGSVKNYNCQYSYWSSSCVDCNFILDCMNCSNCFGCVNLRSKNYCIWNEQYTKDEYLKKIKDLDIGSYKIVKKNFDKFWKFSLMFPRKYARILNCVNSSGDELRECKKVDVSFNCFNSENSKFCYRSPNMKDSMDVNHFHFAELGYEHATGGSFNGSNVKFVINGGDGANLLEYSDFCQASSNLFGCIALKSKNYCILNKQYGKEEYFEMIEKIKKQMTEMPFVDKKGNIYSYGEFFPYEISPFGYNETVANDHFSLSEKEVFEMGYNWKNKIENKYIITKKENELPDHINDVSDSILYEVIECEITKKAFKITPFELQFYRRMNIPIPRIHQDERYKKRLSLRNPMKLWHRKCMKENCSNEFETSYAPDREEIVYCESCYNKEIY